MEASRFFFFNLRTFLHIYFTLILPNHPSDLSNFCVSKKKKEIDSVSCSSEWKKIVFAPYYYNHQGNILDFNFCIIEITQHRRRGLKLWAQSLQSLVCGTWLVARYSPATLSDIHEWEITCSSAQSGGRCFALFPSWNSWLP